MTSLGRVLVVDDDAAMLRVCARVLGAEGWEVVVAEGGKPAIAAAIAATEPFDCVVTDVQMPDLDGFQVIDAIRKHDDDIPVLLMTGDPSLDGAVRAIDSGAVSYLSKPFDHETLAAAVARAARRHGVARMRRRTETMTHGDRLETAARLARALSGAWIAFQPIVEVSTRRVYAYEALIRTTEESLKRPDHLIACAERLGQIHQLGRTVRSLVAAAIPKAPADALLFVNVHGLELTDEDLFATTAPLAPFASRIVLEITEQVDIDPLGGPARVAMLRKLGYRIAVDDLGSGYAALGALASLEPEVVKLDMSLVRGIEQHPTKRRVVGAMATLCRELGSRVVAEGIETVAERTACIDAGVDLLQGFLLAKPTDGFHPATW